jgi:hypothetical protein
VKNRGAKLKTRQAELRSFVSPGYCAFPAGKIAQFRLSPLFRSRRETWPQEKAFTISARFCLACSASRKRALDALRGRKKWSFIAALLDLIETTSREHLQSFGTGRGPPGTPHFGLLCGEEARKRRLTPCAGRYSTVNNINRRHYRETTFKPRILYREQGGENKRSARINFCRDAPPAWIVQLRIGELHRRRCDWIDSALDGSAALSSSEGAVACDEVGKHPVVTI